MEGRGVFFDRDGIINNLIFNPATREHESPHRVEDLIFTENISKIIKPLQDTKFELFVISNQPSYAKGKTRMEDIKAVHEKIDKKLKSDKIIFKEYFYCYHHPDSIVPELKGPCGCRKPSPHFINMALIKYNLDKKSCWMIGDQDTDIECGKRAGIKTILVEVLESKNKRGNSKPSYTVKNLADAINIILKEK